MIHSFYIILAVDFLLAVLVGGAIIKMLLKVAYRIKLFDIPDERKVHTVPVPRLGGMSFMPTLMIVIAFSVGVIYRLGVMKNPAMDDILLIRVAYMLGSAMLLYVFGIMDDLTDLSYRVKFIVQFAASALLVSSGLWLNSLYGMFGVGQIPFYIGMPLTVLLLVLITNAINMIDGIDGLASGISIISLGTLACIFIRERRFIYSTVSVTLLGAVLAFWLFNMLGSAEKRSKLYMGDTGSLTIGLILCFLLVSLCSFCGKNGGITNGKYLAIAFSSLLIPLLEVPRLLFTRLLKHNNPFKADTNHIHHRLMRCGLTARQTLWIILSMDVAIVLLTAAMTRVLSLTWIFIVDVAIYVLIQLAIARKVKSDILSKE